jgi:YbbR domain-containing protein
MADFFNHPLVTQIKDLFKFGTRPGSDEEEVTFLRREKVIVFIGAYIMAVALWFIVNLSGSYSIDVNLPVEPGNVPEDMALTEELPKFVEAGVSGDGWQLLSLYNDPPTVVINIENEEVNLFDQVRQRLSYLQDVDISKVQPLMIRLDMEAKVSKKIPVVLNTDIEFQNRFGMIGEPVISPDSITITGASSRISDINEWVVEDTLRLRDVRNDISTTIPLREGTGVISLSESEISFEADISEFTEGETTVYIRTRGLPRGQNVTYNPASLTITYDVPIEQYADVEKVQPYEAYVPYSEIVEDSTGYVTPDVELVEKSYELRLRNFKPKAVAYFTVIN